MSSSRCRAKSHHQPPSYSQLYSIRTLPCSRHQFEGSSRYPTGLAAARHLFHPQYIAGGSRVCLNHNVSTMVAGHLSSHADLMRAYHPAATHMSARAIGEHQVLMRAPATHRSSESGYCSLMRCATSPRFRKCRPLVSPRCTSKMRTGCELLVLLVLLLLFCLCRHQLCQAATAHVAHIPKAN